MLGSLVPLSMFLSWEAVSLNLIPMGLLGVPEETLPDPAIIMNAAFQPPAAAGGGSGVEHAAGSLLRYASAAVDSLVGAAVMEDVVVPLKAVAGIPVDPLQVTRGEGVLLSDRCVLNCLQGGVRLAARGRERSQMAKMAKWKGWQ